ncbi:MAG: Crp/Fnr family transcriptional regulator [Bradyrhizobium sp.]|uniref:Crp/Fnr family transcriptional regulator n=1 Tax=Bradyrhizobium sp. TaxID=376 RepID=UPI001D228A33|nr:helix-turn-helix domain-containing protein [Bradyrhizobium sp.]MBV9559501.1 Crp/Fnr family transcriptional regulator [Bradyrhizobium sp.]
MLPPREFEALRQHIKSVETVKGAVLAEAGRPLGEIYLPHGGAISLVVTLSEGHMVEIAMVGRDGMVGAAESLGDGVSVTDAVVLFRSRATRLTPSKRMSRWLLRANELRDGETRPMTQELLARMIGVQCNAISIAAHGLQQARVISYSRGQIEVDDVDALQRSACECHGAVKMRRAQLFGNPP